MLAAVWGGVQPVRGLALFWTAAGYDAVQLASALTWQEAVGTEITLATFDRQSCQRIEFRTDSD